MYIGEKCHIVAKRTERENMCLYHF